MTVVDAPGPAEVPARGRPARVPARGRPARVPAQASLSALCRPDCTIARLRGGLDIATTPAMRERLLGLLGPGVRLLIIDMSGVSFCGAAGLAVLIGTQRRAMERHITVRVAAPRPQTAKLLRITDLDRSLTVCATLADALPESPEPGSPEPRSPESRSPESRHPRPGEAVQVGPVT
jgi:anti-anti-sigma factor